MNADDLKKTLTQLHQELKSTDRLDQELQSLLETIDRDIHAMLQKEAAASPLAADWAEQLRNHAARFAAQYPHIETTMREIADALAKMGI